jgi:hypothetical protein
MTPPVRIWRVTSLGAEAVTRSRTEGVAAVSSGRVRSRTMSSIANARPCPATTGIR